MFYAFSIFSTREATFYSLQKNVSSGSASALDSNEDLCCTAYVSQRKQWEIPSRKQYSGKI